MAMVINSNIQSLNAQRHLNNSLDAQNTATERLSSGLRINSAKDDAAGLAIANRMTSQVQGLNQAVRNANDGAALIQTAEGGLEETTNILQRMRELSIQSANGTYDTGNRDTLNAEVEQLKLEIDRIAETTSFNGLSVLDGTLGKVDLQVGENANQTIELEVGASGTKKLGSGSGADIVGGSSDKASLELGLVAALGADGDVKINGISLDKAVATDSLETMLDKINTKIQGVAEAGTLVSLETTSKGTGIVDSTAASIEVLATDGSKTTIEIVNTTSLQNLVDTINEKGDGVVQASLNDDGYLTLSSENAAAITMGGAATDAIFGTDAASGDAAQAVLTLTAAAGNKDGISVDTAANANTLALGINERQAGGVIHGGTAVVGTADIAAGSFTINGHTFDKYDSSIDYDNSGAAAKEDDLIAFINQSSDETGVVASLDSAKFMVLQSDDNAEISISFKDAAADAALLTATGLHDTNSAVGAGANVASIDISSAKGAQKAIAVLDDAIKQVSSTRGDLGAISNRLDYTTRNLSNISENAASARSQIMDADFAAESANLSRAQVLQQAGNAMLAQANSRPQQVLSLLQ